MLKVVVPTGTGSPIYAKVNFPLDKLLEFIVVKPLKFDLTGVALFAKSILVGSKSRLIWIEAAAKSVNIMENLSNPLEIIGLEIFKLDIISLAFKRL